MDTKKIPYFFNTPRWRSALYKKNRVTPVLRNCVGPIEYNSLFKSASLLCKFLLNDHAKHFNAYISPYISLYNTR